MLSLLPLAWADPAADLASLAWLAGDWRGTVQGAAFVTTYTSPEGGMVLSVSKTLEGGRAVFHEFERFEVRDGNVTMTPYPGGTPSVPFTLTGFDPAVPRATFANPAHDFPTEITYAREGASGLSVTLTGKAAGSADVVRFHLSRVR